MKAFLNFLSCLGIAAVLFGVVVFVMFLTRTHQSKVRSEPVTESVDEILAGGDRVITQLQAIAENSNIIRNDQLKRMRKVAVDSTQVGYVYAHIGKSFTEASNDTWRIITESFDIKD